MDGGIEDNSESDGLATPLRRLTRSASHASRRPYKHASSSSSASILERHPAATLVTVLSLGWLAGLFYVWPFPTTVHAMLSLVVALLAWTALQWAALFQYLVTFIASRQNKSCTTSEYNHPLLGSNVAASEHPLHTGSSRWNWLPSQWSRYRRLAVLAASILSIAIITHASPPTEARLPVPKLIPSNPLIPEKYFIAANLYNNEEIFGEWSAELIRLCRHRKYQFSYRDMTPQTTLPICCRDPDH